MASNLALAEPAEVAKPLVSEEEHQKIDALERKMLAECAPIDFPLMHIFSPGLYVRAIFNPAGSLITTRIHKTEHPFIVAKGRARVLIPGHGVEEIEAPYVGITKAGTRRVILAVTDVVWITCHANPEDRKDVNQLETMLEERREWEDGKTTYEHSLEKLKQLAEGQQLSILEV